MKAWLAREWGGPEKLELSDIPTPEPGERQVLVRVEAAALNFLDTLMIRGQYQVKPAFPFVPGVEFAGTVERVGPGSRFKQGDRVAGVVETGAYAAFAVAPDANLIPLPGSVDTVTGAAIAIVYPTAHCALVGLGRLKAGETLLVHSGAGGTGIAAVQIGKALGAKVIATAGGAEKLAICRENGADEALDYTNNTWLDGVKSATGGKGADVIFDPVGGEITETSLKCMAWRCRLLIVGFTSGKIPSIPANRLLIKNAEALGVFWGELSRRDPAFTRATFEALFGMLQRGEIRPYVSKRYAFADAQTALDDLANRRTTGKVVLLPNG